jgi:flagellar protein FlaG
MQIAAMSLGRTGAAVRQELPQERVSPRINAEAKAKAVENFEASLPGNGNRESRTAADIRALTADLEHISLAFNKKLKFVVDHESQEVIVKVIDSQTDKVIKVLPPEELQRLHDRIKETIGFLFDERV